MSKTKKTPEPSAAVEPMPCASVEKAMTAAGYATVRFVGKNIRYEKPGGKRDAMGNKEVELMSVHDVVVSPGLLTKDGNWPALDVVRKLGLHVRETQLFGDELFLRDVVGLKD